MPFPPPSPIPSALKSGQDAEARVLQALHLTKNTEVWRPSPEQMANPAFRAIVGDPHFTLWGKAKGTVLDSVDGELAEIKSGVSPLKSTYQLRLQTYRSVLEERPLKIYTNRPVEGDFRRRHGPWGVRIEPLPPPDLDSPAP